MDTATTSSQRPARGSRCPGLWFNEAEAFALVMMEHLLASLDQGGFIGPHIAPLRARLTAILGTGEASAAEVRKRIRLLAFAPRKLPLEFFEEIGRATLKRAAHPRDLLRAKQRSDVRARRLAATPRSLPRQLVPRRLVPSAQRPADVCLRWHQERQAARRDRARSVGEVARGVPCDELRHHAQRRRRDVGEAALLGGACALGRLRNMASGPAGRFDPAGRYTLELPYRDDRELLLEILKHGAGVEVLAPEELRKKVQDEHSRAAEMNAGIMQ